MTATFGTHNLLLSDGSTTLGLKLATDQKTGRPIFKRDYAPSFADQQFTDVGNASFVAKDRLKLTETTRAGGFGKQHYAEGRYRQAFNVDASYRDIIVPSQVIVDCTQSTPTYATTTTITNGTFETGDLTGWTSVSGGGGTWVAAGGAAARGGSYGAQCVVTGADGAAEIKNQLVSADSSLFGADQCTPDVAIEVVVYGRTNDVTGRTMTATLKDASGTTIASATATVDNAGWTAATISHTFTEGWPKLVVHVSFPEANYTVYLDDVAVTITAGGITTSTSMGAVKMVEFNAQHYAVSSTGVWKRTANNFARVVGSPDNILDCVSDGTNLYLARYGNSTLKQVWAMDSSEVFTRCTGTGAAATPVRLAYIAGSMYGTNLQTTIYKYTSIMAATTTATYTVGETGYNIRSLVNYLALPHVVTERQHDYVNASGTVVPSVVPALFSLYDTNTGRSAIVWNGNLYYPAGAQGIIEYDADTGKWDSIGPSRVAERLADFSGQVQSLAGDDEWLYAFVDNSAKIEVLKGRPIDGVWVWHPFLEDTYTQVYWAGVASTTAKRLWYSVGDGSPPSYIPLPTKYADPLADTSLTFVTGGTYETSGYHFNLYDELKTFQSVSFATVGLTAANQTITVKYWKQGDSSWTVLGTLTSTVSELFFASGGVSTKELWLQFTLNTNNSATGVGIYYWTVNATANPKRIERIYARLSLGDGNSLKSTGDVDTEMTYAAVAAQLHTWADTHPLTLTFPDGTSDGAALTVKFDETFPSEQFIKLGSFEPAVAPQTEMDVVFIAQRTSA